MPRLVPMPRPVLSPVSPVPMVPMPRPILSLYLPHVPMPRLVPMPRPVLSPVTVVPMPRPVLSPVTVVPMPRPVLSQANGSQREGWLHTLHEIGTETDTETTCDVKVPEMPGPPRLVLS